MSHKQQQEPGPSCHVGNTQQVGTQEQQREGDAQTMSSQEQRLLSWVGIALVAAAMGAVQGTDPGPWPQGPSMYPCVLRTASAPRASGTQLMFSPSGTELLGPCSKTWKSSSQIPLNYQNLDPQIKSSFTHKIVRVLFCLPSPGVLLPLEDSM